MMQSLESEYSLLNILKSLMAESICFPKLNTPISFQWEVPSNKDIIYRDTISNSISMESSTYPIQPCSLITAEQVAYYVGKAIKEDDQVLSKYSKCCCCIF